MERTDAGHRSAAGAPAPPTSDAHGDLRIFNHWLCVSRIRASVAVAVFVATMHLAGVGSLAFLPIMSVCVGLFGFSLVVLNFGFLARSPRVFFYVQNVVDLTGITIGIGAANAGQAELLLRSIYLLVIVPASMISVQSGLIVAALATASHGLLLGLDSGCSLATYGTLEAILPPFLFFVVAQQAFFYGGHLEMKNSALTALASRLEEHRARLAALVEVARTLNTTLEGTELLARINRVALDHLHADWGATFLVDTEHRTFSLAASSDVGVGSEIGRMDFPIDAWPVVGRIAREGVVVATDASAEQMSPLFTGGHAATALFLAGLYRERDLVGFLALAYLAQRPGPDVVREQLGAIAEHAAIALRNAQLLDDARQASALKSEFLSTVSHELRTPLHVIAGYTEMLNDGAHGALNVAQRELVGRIDARGRELLELIEAVLHVGRIETGRDAIALRLVRLAELVDVIKSVTEGVPRPAEVTFSWDLPSDLDGMIITDAAKVALVVRNLVSNAFKFTTRGKVTVELLFDAPVLTIAVHDTGVGILPEHIPVIFEMFRQLEGGSARGASGVGLGLYIVKQIVDRLGGCVAVDSTPGRGSCFRVVLQNAHTTTDGQSATHSPPSRHQDLLRLVANA